MSPMHLASLFLALLYYCITPTSAQLSPYPIVQTPLGAVQGVRIKNNTAVAYYSVPYAQPPLGSLRFAYPQPVQPFNTTFNATIQTGLCVTGPTTGSEDCLRMDIYTPANTTSSSKLPVVVIIPGGGYTGLTNFSGMCNHSAVLCAVPAQ